MIEMIKFILRTNLLKTFKFNYHYFGFDGLLKPRVFLSYHVKLEKLKGECYAPKGAHVSIGYFSNFAEEGSHKHLKFWNEGIIDFTGGGQTISKGCSIFVDKNARLTLGRRVHIGPNTGLDCHKEISIRDYTMIAWNCLIMDRDGHDIIDKQSGKILNTYNSIEIGEHCWICFGSLVLKGSFIPGHCVIAAKSTITKHLDNSNSIYVNNKMVKENIDINF